MIYKSKLLSKITTINKPNSKKEELIKQIAEFDDKYFNQDQKNIAINILKNAPEREVQAYADFLFSKVKIGFQFDYSPEIAKGRIITLKEDKNRRINTIDEVMDDENKLIIGDNYNALKSLLITHKNKIDAIYIDPPYNTEKAKKEGNNDSYKEGSPEKFIYKDKFGRIGWLNMMKNRLILAKDLLKEDGLIFISIDDNEQAYLKILLDEIFGEENNLASIVVQKKSGGGQSKSYYKGHDYLFVYTIDFRKRQSLFVENNESQAKTIMIDGVKYIYYPDSMRKMHGKFSKNNLPIGAIKHRNLFLEDYKLIVSREKAKEIEDKIEKKEILPIFFKNGDIEGNILCKASLYNNDKSDKKIMYSIITAWTTDGDKILSSIIGENDFESPKPIDLIKCILKYNMNKNGVILDFFAGSGTTGQAVLDLNREDGGNRKFILVTNNENNIAHNITYERLYRIIKGQDTKGGTKFEWIKNNEPYKNTKLRVIDIDDSIKISLDQENIDERIFDDCKNGLKLLDNKYNAKNLNLYYDLSSLNPLEKGSK
ncbi:MAG: site-specific DNA-methyltransferase [Metamycoplasmataceae bacterium]